MAAHRDPPPAASTPTADALLLAALRDAPRRHRMPPLPTHAGAAEAAGTETALAFAVESARRHVQHGEPVPAEVPALFTRALAALVRSALAGEGGDPSFQALVLRAEHAQVQEHVQLASQAHADRRALRTAVDAVAHPGKLQGHLPGPLREALASLHGLAAEGDWPALAQAAARWRDGPHADASALAWIEGLLAHPALARLQRHGELLRHENVQRYLALCAGRGPVAGSAAATASGRASARLGGLAEDETLHAFHEIAARLQAHDAAGPRYLAVGSLRTPRGFPGEAHKSKDEWDAAVLRERTAGAPAEVLLLAEVKASPAAATPDFARLLRGLQRLALAQPGAAYRFPSTDGLLTLDGDSLRALAPQGHALPAQVIYCCAAPPEAQPPLLSAASRAVLLAEPGSLSFARRLAGGEAPDPAELGVVWDALCAEPRLRSALHQYQTARDVREAMLHPGDLLAELAEELNAVPPGER